MEKEEILYENYKEFKENLLDLKRNLVFVDDIYTQKLEEIEEKLGEKVFDLESSKYYQSFKGEIDELEDKISKALTDFNFNASFDVYKTFQNVFETVESDLSLINAYPLKQSFVKNVVSDVFLYNLSSLKTAKEQIKVVFDNVDKLMEKTKYLIKK